MTDVVDEEAWLLASPQKPRRRGGRVVVAGGARGRDRASDSCSGPVLSCAGLT